jgi:hypothetical protein
VVPFELANLAAAAGHRERKLHGFGRSDGSGGRIPPPASSFRVLSFRIPRLVIPSEARFSRSKNHSQSRNLLFDGPGDVSETMNLF